MKKRCEAFVKLLERLRFQNFSKSGTKHLNQFESEN